VTVKCRLGVDDQDPELALDDVARASFDAGADGLWVHARKAWLEGLSPKQNRDIPPLDYDRVYRLKEQNPHAFIGINGGIASLAEVQAHLAHVDGVMMGRSAYKTPAVLADADHHIFGEAEPAVDLEAAVGRMMAYAERHLAAGGRLAAVTRHMIGLFQGRPGARAWRQILTVESVKPGASPQVIADALEAVRSAGGLSLDTNRAEQAA
jgi:tRNA-dihydrouridine synthase A